MQTELHAANARGWNNRLSGTSRIIINCNASNICSLRERENNNLKIFCQIANLQLAVSLLKPITSVCSHYSVHLPLVVQLQLWSFTVSKSWLKSNKIWFRKNSRRGKASKSSKCEIGNSGEKKTQKWPAALSCCSPPAAWWVGAGCWEAADVGSQALILLPSSNGCGRQEEGRLWQWGYWGWTMTLAGPALSPRRYEKDPVCPALMQIPQHIVHPGTLPGLLTSWRLRRCYWKQVMNEAAAKSPSKTERKTQRNHSMQPHGISFSISATEKKLSLLSVSGLYYSMLESNG